VHVIVNAATSVDGKLSTRDRRQVAISGPEDFDRVDRLRAAADAVLVGVGTVLADDPSLTLDEADRRVERLRSGRPGDPARVVLDTRARTPTDARVLNDDAATHLLVVEDAPDSRVAALADAGSDVEVHRVPADDGQVDVVAGLDALESAGVGRLLVEGGGEVIFSLFAAGVVDELSVYVGSTLIGGRDAPTLADGEGFLDPQGLTLAGVERLDDGVVLSYEP
jgi:2,5-diamino-6-hydroxy-4-(5-phosphoribosylamino)pyrimidine 1''-reductase, archaeal